MVLEELKKAETLIELLRNSGFKSASKPLRPEHFDQEFGDRQYAAALNALLIQLDKVTLNPREVSKYNLPNWFLDLIGWSDWLRWDCLKALTLILLKK